MGRSRLEPLTHPLLPVWRFREAGGGYPWSRPGRPAQTRLLLGAPAPQWVPLFLSAGDRRRRPSVVALRTGLASSSASFSAAARRFRCCSSPGLPSRPSPRASLHSFPRFRALRIDKHRQPFNAISESEIIVFFAKITVPNHGASPYLPPPQSWSAAHRRFAHQLRASER
jgi:hypothetical protein